MIGRRSVALGATALGVAGATRAAAQGRSVLRMAKTSIPRILDPHFTTSFTERDFGYLVYDTLFAVDKSYTPKPQMVERWEVSPDRLAYTFHLRPGLSFHDGAAVIAADCTTSIQRWAQRDGMGQKLAAVTERWQVLDDRSFRLVLKQPYELVLASLGKVGASVPFIMPERIARTPGTEAVHEFVGSGPFRYDPAASSAGVKLVFHRHAGYVPRAEPGEWASGAKRPMVDTIEWIEFRDGMTAVNALTNNEIDLIHELPHDLAPLVEAERDLRVMVHNEVGQLGFVRFNCLHPPFDNVQVRRAVALGIDQRAFLEALVGKPEYYQVCTSVYSCGSPYETQQGVPGFNLAAAREQLRASGYDGKPIVQFHATNSATAGPIGEVLTRALRDIGFTVDVRAMDWSTFTRRRLTQAPPPEGWNIACSTWTAPDVMDPVVNATLSGAGKQAPWGWPSVPEMEVLRERFSREPDAAERRRLAAEVQRLAYDQAIYMPTGTFKALAAFRSNVTGLFPAPALMLWNVGKR